MINKNLLIPILWIFLCTGFSLTSQANNSNNSSNSQTRVYGILPFVKTISQSTQKSLSIYYDDFEKVLQTILSQAPESLKVQYLTGESSLDYFTGEFSQRVAANQRLHKILQAQKLEGLILGNLQESAGQEALELSVVAYFLLEDQAFFAFYHEQIKHDKEKDIQLSQKPNYGDIVSYLGGTDLAQQQAQQPLQPKQLAKNVKQWFTKISNTVSATNPTQPPKGQFGQQKIVFLPGQEKTLKELYTMFYEQEFYVYPRPNDEPTLRAIAQEKGISLSQLQEALTQHWRQREHMIDEDSCEMRGIVSVPQDNQKGIVYKLCFEPSYLETSTWHCPPTGTPPKVTGKMKKMTHQQAKQALADLNAKGQFKDWRLPTLDELFAMKSLLPEPSVGKEPLAFWSATAQTPQKTTWWGLSTDIMAVKNIVTIYRTYVNPLSEKDSAFMIPVRNCPQLNYPYIWQ